MSQQTQLALFDDIPSIEILLAKREDQWFDRKSIRTADHKIAAAMIGFANADGGRIVIGLSEGKVEGIDADAKQRNALLQAAINLSAPPVRHSVHYVECVNERGLADRLLIMDIEASEQIHRNMRDECYSRNPHIARVLAEMRRRLYMTIEAEWQTRKKRIDTKLNALGWQVVPYNPSDGKDSPRCVQFLADHEGP